MADKDKALATQQEESWRSRVFLVGGLVGAVLGLLSAYFYVQAAEEKGDSPPKKPDAKDTVTLGVSLLGIVRTITEWGTR